MTRAKRIEIAPAAVAEARAAGTASKRPRSATDFAMRDGIRPGYVHHGMSASSPATPARATATAAAARSSTARTNRIAGAATQIETGYHEMNASLAEMESTRAQGRRLLGRALLMDSDAMGRHFPSSTSTRRRFTTLNERYEEALLSARRLAYLARRAIEQRLGMRLEDIDRDLGLVERPSEWVDRVCTMSGVDYDRVRSGSAPITSYADGYIGDYVRRLELVVEGYRLAYPFGDTTQTAVISLRDEVMGVRADCTVAPPDVEIGESEPRRCAAASRNLLPFGNSLDQWLDGAGWFPEGCTPLPGTGDVRDCVSASGLPSGESGPPVAPLLERGAAYPERPADAARAFDLRFGGVTATSGTSATVSSRLSQALPLPVGRYRVSWYGRTAGPSPLLNPNNIFWLNGTHVSATQVASMVVTSAVSPWTDPGGSRPSWSRFWTLIQVADPSADTVISFGTDGTLSATPYRVQLSSLMVEDVTEEVPAGASASAWPPEAYMPNGTAERFTLPMAEDTDGRVFRSRWRRDCKQLCSTGFGGTCEADDTTPRCYWETDFTISDAAIEEGYLVRAGGLALGNFNYRFDSIALNFVGQIRECADDSLPSTCYSAAFVPYTIIHDGPFTVRNHVGGTYTASITRGRIEQASGLAAERYITNPVSSADQALLSGYTHAEFRGRPLAGRYTIRVWDVDGVNFEGIEDVQVVLGYRYWSRFE